MGKGQSAGLKFGWIQRFFFFGMWIEISRSEINEWIYLLHDVSFRSPHFCSWICIPAFRMYISYAIARHLKLGTSILSKETPKLINMEIEKRVWLKCPEKMQFLQPLWIHNLEPEYPNPVLAALRRNHSYKACWRKNCNFPFTTLLNSCWGNG